MKRHTRVVNSIESQANISGYVRSKLDRKKVKRLRSPDTNKLPGIDLGIKPETQRYFETATERNIKLKELKKDYPNLFKIR